MNLCISGPDACGKSTLAERLINKYGCNVIHSTAKTRNTLEYHLDLLDYHDNTIFDRHCVGEMIFPYIYNREPKINEDEFYQILQRVIDNNDMYVIFICSNSNILKERLIERGEVDYLEEIDEQCRRYNDIAQKMKIFFNNYKYFYICDIAEENAYNKLYDWVDNNFGRKSVNVVYKQLCKDLIEKGHVMETRNIRGNTKELCNYMFTINDLETAYVSLKSGKSNLTYLAAELLWYWSSRNDTEFISKFGAMWKRLSDDGITNNSAYGYILQEKHGFNQIEKIIELLKVDPYSRRAVLNINVPNENVIDTRDEPCTICIDYQIRNNKLQCTVVMRSSDVWFGLRNDIPYFITLQKYVASRLNIGVGDYSMFLMSSHFYDRDFKTIKDVAYGDMSSSEECLDINMLLDNKDLLINEIDNNFIDKEWFTNLLRERGIIYDR